MENKTTQADSVESPSSSASHSATITRSARRNNLKHAKETGLVHHATTATSHGAQNANAAILERMELPERGQQLVAARVARGIGSARVVVTTTLHSEPSARDASLHEAILQESQLVPAVAVEASEEDAEVVTEEVEDVEDSVTEVVVVVEDSEATEAEVAVVEDSTNLSVASTIKPSRPETKRSSLTNKLDPIALKKISLNCRPFAKL